MILVNELKGKIVAKGLTQGKVAEKLGITQKTFSDKMKKGVFGSDEISIMIQELELDDPMSIFFAEVVTH